jgi:hypothetical protein
MKPLLLIFTFILMIVGSSAAHAGDVRIKGDSHYGCSDEDVYDKTTQMAAQGDREAFAKLLGAGIATGTCTIFKDNEIVFITDHGILNSKVRRKGNVAEYWIPSDALSFN